MMELRHDNAVLWVHLDRVDEATLFAHPGIRIVATPCTGTDHIDRAACERRGIRVLCLRDCDPAKLAGIRATVEHTIGLILAMTRRIPAASQDVARGLWDRMRHQGVDLDGKTVCVVGVGRIGRRVAALLFDSFLMDACWVQEFDDREHLLKKLSESDLVTVHVPLTDRTRGMFNREAFAAMKPGAYFVNTSRGAVVDEPALLSALESGHLAGAALDVLATEPPSSIASRRLVHFAREHPARLIITPHLGGCTVESMAKAEAILEERVKEVLGVPVSA